jgi:hypothetical protein
MKKCFSINIIRYLVESINDCNIIKKMIENQLDKTIN